MLRLYSQFQSQHKRKQLNFNTKQNSLGDTFKHFVRTPCYKTYFYQQMRIKMPFAVGTDLEAGTPRQCAAQTEWRCFKTKPHRSVII